MEFLIPIAFFAAVVAAIKFIVDARVRTKLVSANVSNDLLRSLLEVEEQQRRYSSLRWGIVLSCLGIGFALIQSFDWSEGGPGAIAVVIGATGIGNLLSYLFTRHAEAQRSK